MAAAQGPMGALLGAAGVRFSGFLMACLALTPHLLIEVYFGHASKHVARHFGGAGRAAQLHDLVIVGGLALGVAVMVLVSRMARKAVMRAADEAQSREARDDTTLKAPGDPR